MTRHAKTTIAAEKIELHRAEEYPEDFYAPIRAVPYSHVHVSIDVMGLDDGIVTAVLPNGGPPEDSGIELDITAADARGLAKTLVAAADASRAASR